MTESTPIQELREALTYAERSAVLAAAASLHPQGHAPEDIRMWIALVCKELNISPTQLAKAAGVAPSTVNRFVADEGSSANLSSNTINKLSSAARLAYTDKDAPLAVEGRSGLLPGDVPFLKGKVIPVTVIGSIDDEHHRLNASWRSSSQYAVAIPLMPGVRSDQSFVAWELRSSQVGAHYKPFSILVSSFKSAWTLEEVSDGDVVVCFVRTDAGSGVIARECKFDPSGDLWLVSRSANSADEARPIFLGREMKRDDAIVVGIVYASIQFAPRFAPTTPGKFVIDP